MTIVSIWRIQYMTPKDLARHLQVNVRTVRRWLVNGQIEAVRVGRQWRIPGDAVERWLRREILIPDQDWLATCRRARAMTAPGADSTALLRALREERAAR